MKRKLNKVKEKKKTGGNENGRQIINKKKKEV